MVCVLFLLPSAQVLRILDNGGNFFENLLQTLCIELACAVIVVDAVLLLFHIGHLGIAEANDVLTGF